MVWIHYSHPNWVTDSETLQIMMKRFIVGMQDALGHHYKLINHVLLDKKLSKS
jgi:hypothetical protein